MALATLTLEWRDPVAAAAPFADQVWSAALVSDGGPQGRWSYLAINPDHAEQVAPDDTRDPFERIRALLPTDLTGPAGAEEPPFRGGLIGLLCYEAGARIEPSAPRAASVWPDLAVARYPAVLAFDHHRRRVLALGQGADLAEAERQAARAASWLDIIGLDEAPAGPLAQAFEGEAPEHYERAVAELAARIAAGELFQANIARTWSGRLELGRRPYELLRRLARSSPAPFAAYLRLPRLALVSNSPERFVRLQRGVEAVVESRPIKGTRPRAMDHDHDAALVQDLIGSEKDRAENLMIVDLMRNDLARVCTPGGVSAPELFAVESYANVHHLVSTVRGRLANGREVSDVLAATFPPGSITGAPKPQAMKVIAGYEGARGPWCGALFWAGADGALDSSVLIRTAAFVEEASGWRFEAKAGAGIVADSDPVSERLETEAKISALRRALLGD